MWTLSLHFVSPFFKLRIAVIINESPIWGKRICFQLVEDVRSLSDSSDICFVTTKYRTYNIARYFYHSCTMSGFGFVSHSAFALCMSQGVFGKHCELNSYGFEELSYMEFPSLDPNNNYIYIKFATLKSNALLMYNHDNQTGDKAEFLALEIFEGRMRFSFNLGSGTYKLMTMIKVSDGQFHTVIARRAGMVRTSIFIMQDSSLVEWLSSCIPETFLLSGIIALLGLVEEILLKILEKYHVVWTCAAH